MTEHDRQNVNW